MRVSGYVVCGNRVSCWRNNGSVKEAIVMENSLGTSTNPITRTMKVAVITAPQEISIQQTDVPEPGQNEVGIRLEGSGVCASNLPVWEGRQWFQYPFAPGSPGHEGWGR